MNSRLISLALFACAIQASGAASPFPTCSGKAKYKVTFFNFLTAQIFGDLIPEAGLVFSPLAAVTHSGRVSFFTVRGFANRQTETVAEKGINRPFLRLARRLRRAGRGVKTVIGADGPTMPGKTTVLIVDVDCDTSFLTVIGMIAPSPDWIVQINNRNLFDIGGGRFVTFLSGNLIAYDTGVDDGRDFTPPLNTSLDIPTKPQKNIAPLVEDATDRFEGRVLGKFIIKRI